MHRWFALGALLGMQTASLSLMTSINYLHLWLNFFIALELPDSLLSLSFPVVKPGNAAARESFASLIIARNTP